MEHREPGTSTEQSNLETEEIVGYMAYDTDNRQNYICTTTVYFATDFICTYFLFQNNLGVSYEVLRSHSLKLAQT